MSKVPSAWIVTLLFSVTCANMLVARQLKVAKDPCIWMEKQNKTPKALQGTHGSPKDEYYFQHVSDVEKNGGLFNYEYLLKNLHSVKVLPAEWESAEIIFRQIGVGGCGYNSVSSSRKFGENKTVIKYGPINQNKKDAPAYLAIGLVDDTNHPALTSRLHALGDSEQGANAVLDMVFTSEVRDGQCFYTLTNRGDIPFHYVIPELTQALAEFNRSSSTTSITNWDRVGVATYRARAGQTYSGEVSIGGAKTQERIVSVYIMRPQYKGVTGRPNELTNLNPFFLAKGRFSIYIPERTAPPKNDQWVAINGNWRPTLFEVDGNRLPDDDLKEYLFVFSEGKYTVKRGGETIDEGKVMIAPNKTPKELDLMGSMGDSKNRIRKGIYEVKDDALKFVTSDEERPTKLEAPAGSKRILLELKRVK